MPTTKGKYDSTVREYKAKYRAQQAKKKKGTVKGAKSAIQSRHDLLKSI